MSLPFIDRHEARVAADAHAVFDALVALLRMRSRFMQQGIGRLLVRKLRGAGAADQTGVGPAGRLYRRMVIGTGAHAVMVRRTLGRSGPKVAALTRFRQPDVWLVTGRGAPGFASGR
jgi:hypothetical protein